jgi:hypothetical protein
MRLRLWANWEPATPNSRPYGYHSEVERPYDRVPIAGETLDLPVTRLGLAHAVIERVSWDEEMANLLLGSWDEAEGAQLTSLTEVGFHMTGAPHTSCRYCQKAH